jgi:asparagine synthase (glutamine-hydrolysing)
LDHRVVELAARMPAELRLNGLTEKFILKQIAKDQVPAQLVNRPKQPYRAPISRCFMSGRSPDYVDELLSESALKQAGYFHPGKVGRLLAKCRRQDGRLVSERENMALVAILSTQLLDHQFVRNFPAFSESPMEHTVLERQEI